MSDRTYAASDRVIFTPLVDGTGVLLHLDSKFYFTLNATGSAVWRRISESPATVDAIAEHLAETFEVSADDARGDVADLLAELAEESLVEQAG